MKPEKINRIAYSVLVRRSVLITVVLAILATIGGYYGSKVQLKLSLTDLLPDKHPAVVKFEKLTEVVGGVGYFTIILNADDGKSHLSVAPKVVAELKKSPLIRSVFFDREQRFFTDRLLYYSTLERLEKLDRNIDKEIKKARRKIIDLGLWEDKEPGDQKEQGAFDDEMKKHARKAGSISPYLTSKDMKHLLIMVKPSFDSTDLNKSRELVSVAQAAVKDLPQGVTFDFGERYYKKVVETDMISGDIILLGSLSMLLILLILYLALRDLRTLVVIFAPVMMALGITMGITYWVIGHINIVTGFLIGILSGLGVDYGTHMCLRVRLERREPSSDHPDPLWRTIQSTGHTIFIGSIVAAMAFYLLCFSSFRAFSEFGFICGTGLVAVLVCLLSTFWCFARLVKLHTRTIPERSIFSFIRFPVLSVPRGLWTSVGVMVVFLACSAFVGFEYDFEKMMRHSAEMERLQNLIDVIYDRSNTPSAFAAYDYETAIGVENLLKEKYIPSTVSELISGASIIPENQEQKAVVLASIRSQLSKIKDKWIEKTLDVPADAVRTWLNAKPFGFTDLPAHIQDALRGTKHSGYLLYLYPAIKLSTAQGVRTYASMIRDCETRYPQLVSGSDAVVFSDILDLMNHDGILILIAIVISVGIFIWINVRDIRETLICYVPLLLAFVVGTGLMALIGVKFNIFNVAIIPSFVALGIDVPLHIVHRAREVKSGHRAARDLASSINLALSNQAVGFGVLIFARAGVLKSLGWLALLGSVGIWWVGLMILPAFLEWSYRRSAVRTAGVSHTADNAQMAFRADNDDSKRMHQV